METMVEGGARERLRQTVRPGEGRVPAYVLTDPDVYRLEAERVFGRCWLFVAHESEVASPGDYVTRYMGEHPVIAARGEDGAVRVLLNVCRHRGMRVCRADVGNSSHFRCPYHGFTYRNSGQLIGVPLQAEVYGQRLDKSRLGLVEARVETCDGLVFATWDERAPALGDWLGPMRWYLDLIAGRAEMEVVGPPQRYTLPTNWKLPAENFASDAYHTMHSHASIPRIGLTPSPQWAKSGYQIQAGHGHGAQIGAPSPNFVFAPELLPEFERRLSRGQLEILKQMGNMPGNVFPNLSFLVSSVTLDGRLVSHTELFQWQPQGPDRVEVLTWLLMEKAAPPAWKDLSRRAFILSFGSAGVLAQDDTENWTDIARNSRTPVAGRLEFNYEMGLDLRPIDGFPGPGEVYDQKYTEVNARAFYARWLQLLLGEEEVGR